MKPPVLLILFNRPDLTEELFSIIEKNCGHRKIYIAIDGPRQNNDSDSKLCAEVVRLANNFASQHKDHCRLLIQPKNLGCGNGVKAAIDWFFENEEAGIILEDDCHPNADFFWVLDDLLERYRSNESIFMVSGTCFLPNGLYHSADYFLSKYAQIWGWGTWRRVWKNYQFVLDDKYQIELQHMIKQTCLDYPERLYWLNQLSRLRASNPPFTWDYQLQFMAWKNGQKSLIPSKNLVINKGFTKNATNTITNENKKNLFLKSSYDQILSNKIHCDLSYNADHDKIIFWFCILCGDINRFRQIINESDCYFDLETDYSCEKKRKQEEVDILQAKIDWMENSLSWKLTRPLRQLLSSFTNRR